MIRIAHVAYWTPDLDRAAGFWRRWFAASVGELYASRNQPGFSSRFVTLAGGATIELMHRQDLAGPRRDERPATGLAHLAISLGSVEAVDAMAERAAEAGLLVASPRWTGDGYYEAILEDPDCNRIEITL